MKKIIWIFLLIMSVLLVGMLVSCRNDPSDQDETTSGSHETTESPDTDEHETGKESESETVKIELDGEHGDLIECANELKNGVVSYYADAARQEVILENLAMSLGYCIDSSGDMMLSYLANRDGEHYLENTMDVFVELTNGQRYYASSSIVDATFNIYRNGYYYYENRLEGQTFLNALSDHAYVIDPAKRNDMNGINNVQNDDGTLSYQIKDAADPWIAFDVGTLSTADYEYLEVTLLLDGGSAAPSELYIIAGAQTQYNGAQLTSFEIKSDGEYHTYMIPLTGISDYTGTLRGVRLDINGVKGAQVSIRSMRLVRLADAEIPASLAMQRSFLTYSDKLHQVIQLATGETVNNVASVGVVTEIPADTVAQVIVKDKNGIRRSFNGVDWASAEYVAFDIKDVGIFGYILPCDNRSGSIEVTRENGVYTIVQKKTPTGGRLVPSPKGTGNASDFYMGNRLYNDESHDFDAFIREAECERNPLTSENVKVISTDNARFAGYQALYGYYKFTVSGTDFNQAYYSLSNKHFRVQFSITGDNYDRNIYVATYTASGNLESAVLLDSRDMLLPVPVEVCKNFAGDGENTIFNLDDIPYGEAYLPLYVQSGETVSYSVLNLYQNWGAFPLKQISSIQYFRPYYHLSTGVTETNCISPLVQSGPALPDFRAMSAPMWANQPQHTQGGSHNFFAYTDSDGNYHVSENTSTAIDAYGLSYCDMTLGYTSADGKISATYTHTEMPQLDENRTYYEMTFTFLEDVSFSNFAENFYFYRVGPNNLSCHYEQVGYLDKNNQPRVVSAVSGTDTAKYVLGDNCPYFSFFDMPDYIDNGANIFGYVNVAGFIADYEIIHEGAVMDTALVLVNTGKYLQLSLDLKKFSFKAGDTITMNMILLPWGSEQLDYTVEAPDQLVRTVRENSLLNPLTVTAKETCVALESVFVPKAQTTNGKSATFTLSGGNDNSAVRIYGFDKLTVPKIEEYVNGAWQEYVVNSHSQPDKQGNAHYYDGYMVYYDGDGTYSYSFIIPMDNGIPRTFRITADEDFAGWPESEGDQSPETDDDGYVSSASGYKESDLPYAACIDMINGMGGANPNFIDVISSSKKGVVVLNHNGTTIAGSKLILSGWAGVEGGIEKYLWSADGGKTWIDCAGYNAGVRNGHDGILNAITDMTGYTFTDRAASMQNGVFQGAVGTGANTDGIAADLTEYVGQTVDVTFAAVPKSATDTLIVLAQITNVEVHAAS